MALQPPPEADYATLQELFVAVQTHAKAAGYAVIKKRSKPSYSGGNIVKAGLLCDRGGFAKQKPSTYTVKTRKKGSIKCGCPFKVNAIYKKSLNVWTVDLRNPEHNHDENEVPDCSAALRKPEKTNELLDRIDHASRAGMYYLMAMATLLDDEF